MKNDQEQPRLFDEPSEPTFTAGEWDEIQRFRVARMIETGKRIPSLDELRQAMKRATRGGH